MQSLNVHNYYSAQIHAVNQLSIHGAVAHWCEKQQVPATNSSACLESELVPCDLLSYLAQHETGDSLARSSSTKNRNDKIANLCENSKIGDSGFVWTVSKGQYFMTGPKLDEFYTANVCREHTRRRDHPETYTKGSIGVKTKIGPALDVIANIVHGMYRVEINIQFMQTDGTESWVVISSSIEKYVVECSIGNVEEMRDDSQDLSTKKSAALLEYEGAPLSRTMQDVPIPMSQRNW